MNAKKHQQTLRLFKNVNSASQHHGKNFILKRCLNGNLNFVRDTVTKEVQLNTPIEFEGIKGRRARLEVACERHRNGLWLASGMGDPNIWQYQPIAAPSTKDQFDIYYDQVRLHLFLSAIGNIKIFDI